MARASSCGGAYDNGLLWVPGQAREDAGRETDLNVKQQYGCESAFSRRVASELCVSFHPLIE
jgi:hypothetical protein